MLVELVKIVTYGYTLTVLIFARTNFRTFAQKKSKNGRKLVPNFRSKDSTRKLIRFKIKIFLLKNSLPGDIRGESCEHDLGSLLYILQSYLKKNLIYYNYRAVHVTPTTAIFFWLCSSLL